MIDRNRVTERVSASTLKLELRRAIQPLIVLAVGFVIAGAAGYYIVNSINGGIGGTHTMQFAVSDATGVVPGRAEVRFYGIQAGLIDSATVEHGRAVLSVSVANKFGRVFKNATAAVRPNTPLNDMYLDITSRGTRSAGIAGPNDVIPVSQTTSPTNLADVLNAFQPDVRTQMYNLIDQLGNGLADRGADLKQAFVLLSPFLKIAGNVAGQLAVRSTLTKELVHNAAFLSTVLSSRSTQLHNLVVNGSKTLQALATQGGAPLQTTIQNLPEMLHTTVTIFEAAQRAFPNTEAVIAAAHPVAADLPQGLTNLQNLARSANPAVVKLETPVQKLVPLAQQLQPFSADLAGSLTQIKPQITNVDQATTAVSDCTLEINEFFNWDTSMSKWVDELGPFVRGNFNFGFYTAPGITAHNGNYGYRPQCYNGPSGPPIGHMPTPKFNGPPPIP